VVVVLIVFNGVLAMAELAVVSSRRARPQALADRSVVGSRRALALASDPGRFLSTVQIGITLVGVLSGAFSGATLGIRQAAILLGIYVLTTIALQGGRARSHDPEAYGDAQWTSPCCGLSRAEPHRVPDTQAHARPCERWPPQSAGAALKGRDGRDQVCLGSLSSIFIGIGNTMVDERSPAMLCNAVR
jgi:hypothetical protein